MNGKYNTTVKAEDLLRNENMWTSAFYDYVFVCLINVNQQEFTTAWENVAKTIKIIVYGYCLINLFKNAHCNFFMC